MKKYLDQKTNYDKFPVVAVPAEFAGECVTGWDAIGGRLREAADAVPGDVKTIAVECYQGVADEEVLPALREAFPGAAIFRSADAMLPSEVIDRTLGPDITDDDIFGYMTRYDIDVYFDPEKVEGVRRDIGAVKSGVVLIYGTGAAYICGSPDLLVYADMARWELQMRFRRNEISNIGVDNRLEKASLQYKRAFFVDWRVCDRFKKTLIPRWDFVLDTNAGNRPKMATGEAVRAGLRKATARPFRVVPFFDPGPWGGQWMKEVCDLDPSQPNYAWCFDCVPEENSLLLDFGGTSFELPAIDLVFTHPRELLGEAVHGRFGDEFPIRFDFLDTMDGGNLSLQVHPLTEYIQQKFGMHYTQDESYYMLDTEEDAVVYLGLRNDVDPERMISELKEAQTTGRFDAEKHVGVYPVKKHDHILIPAGTVHCSGRNSMVLEISATPFIFTFKLWDWGRLGLDGLPRPINISHGEQVIQWDRREEWVRNEALDRVEVMNEGDGWVEERTGLHEREFIETRRHWFTAPVTHATDGSVNVLNLVEGREAIVESPSGQFEPFIVHYAETFIIPAAVGEYVVRPYGESAGKECATIKAFVRHNA